MPVEAEDQGKVVITTELGGGGRVPEPVHRLAWSGLNERAAPRRASSRARSRRARRSASPDAVIIDGRDPTNYVIAEETGLFEGLKEPGETVSGGEPVGRLWFPDQLGRDPVPLARRSTASSPCIRAVPVTEAGDSVFVDRPADLEDDLLEP